MATQKTLVVIPTYNERENISVLFESLKPFDFDVLIVDDGSPDGTGVLIDTYAANDNRVHSIHRAKKLGLGSAYRDGFQWALDRGYEVIVQMDADGSHDITELPKLYTALERADLVIGSRYTKGGSIANWSLGRRLVSRLGNWYINIILFLKKRTYRVSDSTSGFKAWRAAALKIINPSSMRSDGYAFQIETNWIACKNNLRIIEIPITFRDRTAGASKIGRSNIFDTFLLPLRLH